MHGPGKDPPSVRPRVHRSAQNRLGRSADRPRLGVGGRKKTAAPTKPQQLDRSRREPDIRGVSIGCTSASPVCIVTNPHAHCRPAGSRALPAAGVDAHATPPHWRTCLSASQCWYCSHLALRPERRTPIPALPQCRIIISFSSPARCRHRNLLTG
jgi:hypothetical protein